MSYYFPDKNLTPKDTIPFVHSHFVFPSLSDPQQFLSLKSTMVKIIVQTIAAITIRKHSITTVKNDF